MAASSAMQTYLPVARIKTIMKSSPDVSCISHESIYLITKSTEMFIEFLARESSQVCEGTEMNYSNLASFIQDNEVVEFLADICPKKIKVHEWREKYCSKVTEEEGSLEQKEPVEHETKQPDEETETETKPTEEEAVQ